MKRILTLAIALFGVIALGAGALTASAASPSSFSLFGAATMVPGGVQLVSNANTGVYSGVDYTAPAGTTLGSITNLSTDYKFTSGDCGLGSPRFSIVVSPTQNVFVYIGPPPNFTGCGTAPQNTGNLLTSGARCDFSQLGGGQDVACNFGPYAGLSVSDVALVADDGASPSNSQTLIVNNIMVNNATFSVVGPPTSKDQCKDGGYQKFNNPSFKNQGDCVSFVATHGRNPGNG